MALDSIRVILIFLFQTKLYKLQLLQVIARRIIPCIVNNCSPRIFTEPRSGELNIYHFRRF